MNIARSGDNVSSLCFSAPGDHVYENTCLGDPIYEPVNVFLGLVRREDTISPDPNIYEVPPGAIKTSADMEEKDSSSLLPPPGFLDYENVYVMMTEDKHNKVLITIGDSTQEVAPITTSQEQVSANGGDVEHMGSATQEPKKVTISITEEGQQGKCVDVRDGEPKGDKLKSVQESGIVSSEEMKVVVPEEWDVVVKEETARSSQKEAAENKHPTREKQGIQNVIDHDLKQKSVVSITVEETAEGDKAEYKIIATNSNEKRNDISGQSECETAHDHVVKNKNVLTVDGRVEYAQVIFRDAVGQAKSLDTGNDGDAKERICEEKKSFSRNDNAEKSEVRIEKDVSIVEVNGGERGVMLAAGEAGEVGDEGDLGHVLSSTDLLVEEPMAMEQQEVDTGNTQDEEVMANQDGGTSSSFIEISEDGSWETRNLQRERRLVLEKLVVRARRVKSWVSEETGGKNQLLICYNQHAIIHGMHNTAYSQKLRF